MKFLRPRFLLHLEGAAALALACFAYERIGAPWLVFAALFLAPDLFMLGFLLGPRRGAVFYNVAHTYLAPLILWLIGYIAGIPELTPLSLVWAAHIGFDRLLGFGLKYQTHFKDTHLSRL